VTTGFGSALAPAASAGSEDACAIASDAPVSVVVRADASVAASLDAVSDEASSDAAEADASDADASLADDGSSDAELSAAEEVISDDSALGPTGMTTGRAIGTGGATDDADASDAADGAAEEAASDDASADDAGSPDDASTEDGSSDDGASEDGASLEDTVSIDDGATEDDTGSNELTCSGGTRSTLTAGGSAGSGRWTRGNTSQAINARCNATETAAVATIRRSRGGGPAVRVSGMASLMG
jgi:hypothetical protein